jgi:hypothetical protein
VETRNKGRQGAQHKETWREQRRSEEHRDERQIGGNRDGQRTDELWE